MLLFVAAARADEIRLKDGSKIIGTIVGFEDGAFKVQTNYGFAMVRKDQIVEIIPSPPKPEPPAPKPKESPSAAKEKDSSSDATGAANSSVDAAPTPSLAPPDSAPDASPAPTAAPAADSPVDFASPAPVADAPPDPNADPTIASQRAKTDFLKLQKSTTAAATASAPSVSTWFFPSYMRASLSRR